MSVFYTKKEGAPEFVDFFDDVFELLDGLGITVWFASDTVVKDVDDISSFDLDEAECVVLSSAYTEDFEFSPEAAGDVDRALFPDVLPDEITFEEPIHLAMVARDQEGA